MKINEDVNGTQIYLAVELYPIFELLSVQPRPLRNSCLWNFSCSWNASILISMVTHCQSISWKTNALLKHVEWCLKWYWSFSITVAAGPRMHRHIGGPYDHLSSLAVTRPRNWNISLSLRGGTGRKLPVGTACSHVWMLAISPWLTMPDQYSITEGVSFVFLSTLVQKRHPGLWSLKQNCVMWWRQILSGRGVCLGCSSPTLLRCFYTHYNCGLYGEK